MLIVDAQVHIWSAGPPTNQMHRQVASFSAEECLAEMDAAGVDAALLHPPGWDPNSGAISEDAAEKYRDAGQKYLEALSQLMTPGHLGDLADL